MSRKQGTMYVCMVGILFIMMGISQAAPMGTTFLYQGRLTDQGDPASGSYDIKFHLYDASSGGSLLGTETKNGVVLLDGYFDVELDFGSGVFSGDARWLEIEVAPADSGSFTPLIPRQELTPTPYALYALNGPSSGGFWTDSGDNIYNTNSGNVGIGTINPIFELDVEGVIRSSNVGSSTGEVQLSGPDGSPGLIFLSNDPEGYRANIVRKSDGLGFGVHADTSNPGAEEMWISNSGNVGIGISTPHDKLEVANGAVRFGAGTYKTGMIEGGRIFIDTSETIPGFSNDAWIFEKSDNTQSDPDSPIAFVTVGVDDVVKPRLVIKGNGNIGIGTTSPGVRLDVQSDWSRMAQMHAPNGYIDFTDTMTKFESLVTNAAPQLWLVDQDNRNDRAIIHAQGNAGAVEALWVSSSGNVGIGTTEPVAKLDVRGEIHTGNIEVRKNDIGNRYAYIDFHGDDTYTDYGLRLMRSNAGEDAYSRLAHRGNGQLQFIVEDAGMIRFFTNSLGRMKIDSFGNVGIGTESPGDKLQVGSGISLHDGGHKIIGFGYSPGTGNATYPGYPAEIRFDPAAGCLRIGTTADSITEGDPVTGMSEKLRIDKDGNVGIGTTEPSRKLEVVGGVIGRSSSSDSAGVYGANENYHGIEGVTSGCDYPSRIVYGVYGRHTVSECYGGLGGFKDGVYGYSETGCGVFGRSDHHCGVEGIVGSGNGEGVFGITFSTDSNSYGVVGLNDESRNWGCIGGLYSAVEGHAEDGLAGYFSGDVHIGGDVHITGTLTAIGEKDFIQPHPKNPSKEIVYIAAEAPEAVVFHRGTGRLKEGMAIIDLPEYFSVVAAEEGIQVQVTPHSADTFGLAVVQRSRETIVVKELKKGRGNFEFDYFVSAVRAGFEDHEPMVANTHFKPEVDKTAEDFEERYSKDDMTTRAIRSMLISNGILTEDGKLNMVKANELGWTVAEKDKAPEESTYEPRKVARKKGEL